MLEQLPLSLMWPADLHTGTSQAPSWSRRPSLDPFLSILILFYGQHIFYNWLAARNQRTKLKKSFISQIAQDYPGVTVSLVRWSVHISPCLLKNTGISRGVKHLSNKWYRHIIMCFKYFLVPSYPLHFSRPLQGGSKHYTPIPNTEFYKTTTLKNPVKLRRPLKHSGTLWTSTAKKDESVVSRHFFRTFFLTTVSFSRLNPWHRRSGVRFPVRTRVRGAEGGVILKIILGNVDMVTWNQKDCVLLGICSDLLAPKIWINNYVLTMGRKVRVKAKGKVHPRTGHEDPKGEQRYNSTLSLTSALDWGGWSTPRPGRFTPAKNPVPIV
jgi:hypothetical protein